MSEVETLITKADQFPIQFTQELKFIIEEKERTENFKNKITNNPNPLNPESLQKLISENDSCIF